MTHRFAVKFCCHTHHTVRAQGRVRDERIIPMVMATIAYCDERSSWAGIGGSRFAAAADRLRDFATVELLCEGLGIARKDLN